MRSSDTPTLKRTRASLTVATVVSKRPLWGSRSVHVTRLGDVTRSDVRSGPPTISQAAAGRHSARGSWLIRSAAIMLSGRDAGRQETKSTGVRSAHTAIVCRAVALVL